MEKPVNCIKTIWRFPGISPDELGALPDLSKAFKVEAKHHDEKGGMILREEFDTDGVVTESYVYGFNEKGLVVSHTHYFGEELSEEERISYDEADRPLKEEKIFADGSVTLILSEYNEGKIMAKKIFDEEGVSEGSEQFTYEEDRLVLHEKYDSDGKLTEQYKAKWSKEGEDWILKESTENNLNDGTSFRTVHSGNDYVVYDGKGSKYASHSKKFNEKGKMSENHYSTLARDLSAFYVYDEQDRLSEEERFTGDALTFKSKTFYGEDGSVKMLHATEASAGMFTDLFVTESKR